MQAILRNDDPQRPNWRPGNKLMSAQMRETIEKEGIERLVAFFGAQHTLYSTPSYLPNARGRLSQFRGQVLHLTAQHFHVRDYFTGLPVFVAVHKKEQLRLQLLFDRYLHGANRMAIIPADSSGIKRLARDADYVLLADDAPVAP